MSLSPANWICGLKSNLFGPGQNRAPRVTHPARPPRLSVECLEDRAVPATHTWTDGGLTNNWSDAGNWAGGVPTTGEAGGTIVVFPTSDPTSSQNIVGLVVNRIDFTSAGNTITLNTPLGLDGTSGNQITNTTGTNTITGGTINLSGSTAYLQVGAGTVTIASVIAGPQGIRKLGAGTLDLTETAANTYTGPTTIADGTLLLDTNTGDAGLSNAVTVGDGTGTAGSAVLRLPHTYEIFDGASVTINPDGLVDVPATGVEDVTTLAVNGGAVTIAAGGVFEIQPGGTVSTNGTTGAQITGAGSFRLQNGTVTFNIADGGGRTDLLVTTPITQTALANLTKTGAGVLTLSGVSALTGTVTISQGAVEVVDGGTLGAVAVAGGTLAGNGRVGAVTATGGTVAPGLGDSVKTLSTGDLTLNGVAFSPTISNTGSDQLDVTGAVNLTGATLNPNALGTAPAVASYTLINNDGTDPVVGTFVGLAQGAIVTIGGQKFVLSYTGGDGNDVTLTPPMYSNAQMFGDLLVLQGAGVQGGFQIIPMPSGTVALFSDLTGDGYGDVILFMPTFAMVVDGATGRLVALSLDLNDDGVRDLQFFNPDGTSTITDGKTGLVH